MKEEIERAIRVYLNYYICCNQNNLETEEIARLFNMLAEIFTEILDKN